MGVTTEHGQYALYKSRWQRSEDFFDGEDTVKLAREKYLKKTSQHRAIAASGKADDAEHAYEAYVDKAELPDVYQSSIIGLTGLACNKKWDVVIPPAMKYLEENASAGIPLEGMQSKLIQGGLLTGRLGHFVDSDPIDSELRVMLYDAVHVPNWKEDYNKVKLVVLMESHEADEVVDIFSHDTETHYRVLRLGRQGAIKPDRVTPEREDEYIVELYKMNSDSEYEATDAFEMDFQEGKIPFVFQGSTGLSTKPDMIPLEGMLLQCHKYYKLSADLYHDIYMSNMSTLFGKGFEKGDISFAGAGAAVITSNVEADLKYVATKGEGQKNAILMMDRKLESAEKQSHRMTDVSGGVEASSTLKQKIATKTASLRSVEQQAVAAFQQDLRYIAMMKGLDPKSVTVTSEYDYSSEDVDAVLLKAISESVAMSRLPEEVLFDYSRAAKLTEMTDEQMRASIKKSLDAADKRMSEGFDEQKDDDEFDDVDDAT